MQFLKTIDSKKISGNNYEYSELFKTDKDDKVNFKNYIDKLLFVPHLHNSKSGVVNTLNKFTEAYIEEKKAEIDLLYSQNIVSERLKNIFHEIHQPEHRLSSEDKEELKELYEAGKLSDELKDIVIGIFEPFQLIPDMAASQIKLLYEKEFLNERIIRECLKCCRDLVLNIGYEDLVICTEITLESDSLKTIVNQSDVNNIMIIPGCQHEGMLTGRILKAVRILDNFNNNLKVIASGGNPLENPTGPSKVSRTDESAFIIATFQHLVTKLNINTKNVIPFIKESKSWNSTTNIINSLKDLAKEDKHNIIIVSSTFHLIKLARAVEKTLAGILKDNPNKEFVKNIILIGAEGIDANFTPAKSAGYIKSMFNEVYAELLNISRADSNGIVK